MFSIRDYKKSDFEQVMNLHLSVMKHAGVYKGDGSWDEDLKDIETSYLNNGGAFLVGHHRGSLCRIYCLK